MGPRLAVELSRLFDPHLHELADAELLGLLLAGGRSRGESTRRALAVLGEWGGLAALPGVSRTMLLHCGLRDTQASPLLVVCEIACRLVRQCIPDRAPLSRPDDVARFLAVGSGGHRPSVIEALVSVRFSAPAMSIEMC